MPFALHYFLHLLFPYFVARIFYTAQTIKVYMIFLCTMLVDIDHLLANPIYLADRCSIGFHPLHTIWAIGVYAVMLMGKQYWRIVGIGLLMHMATDGLDCIWMRQ